MKLHSVIFNVIRKNIPYVVMPTNDATTNVLRIEYRPWVFADFLFDPSNQNKHCKFVEKIDYRSLRVERSKYAGTNILEQLKSGRQFRKIA